jgi:hypothetical protein
MSLYVDQQSLMTVVPTSIQSLITVIKVSSFLSGTGTRNVLFYGFAFNKTEHTLPFQFVSPIVLSSAELAVADFDSVITTTDFLIADQHMLQLYLSTEFGPLSDVCRTELMPFVDSVGRYLANDVVSEEQNPHEIRVTLVKPSTLPK